MRLVLLCVTLLVISIPSSYAEMYKWVDDKGTVHFTDDLSTIPEKYREDAETRKPSKEISTPSSKEKPKPSLPAKTAEP